MIHSHDDRALSAEEGSQKPLEQAVRKPYAAPTFTTIVSQETRSASTNLADSGVGSS